MGEKITVPDLIRMRKRNEKIVMLTAYDYPVAKLLDAAGVEIVLIGDSLGTVVQGKENTLPVTLDEIIYHSKMVTRACKRALVVGDMPFMSFQLGPKEALAAAGRLVKEGGVAAVKLEGGKYVCDAIERIVRADIPVMGHVGLTPQSFHRMGGHRVQGRDHGTGPGSASRIIEDAKAVESAGAFSVVLEGMPSELAGKITALLSIPTIGIGAGPNCAGQVLVVNDLLGLTTGEAKLPKFVKTYADLSGTILQAVGKFKDDVRAGVFPDQEHSYTERPKAISLKRKQVGE